MAATRQQLESADNAAGGSARRAEPGAERAAGPEQALTGAPSQTSVHLPSIMRLQRSAGNAAVAGLLSLQRSVASDELRETWKKGKGPFFERLRHLTRPDPDVRTLVETTLSGDDLWLARNLLDHGPEATWPIQLRVEREMKGWPDSHGKGEVFNILRAAAGAQAGNAALTATLYRIFAAGSDDLWLATNLQAHGPEAGWPIELRVEREMKGWPDSRGKGEVFNILRAAAGGQAGNAALKATLNRIFAAGTDDLRLATILQAYGPESSWGAHLVSSYVVPFDRTPLSAPGEQIIFRGEFTFPLPDYHELDYTAVGGTFDSSTGPANKTISGLKSGNVNFFLDSAWTGTPAVTVKLEVKSRSDGTIIHTDTWTFDKKRRVPTTMTQVEGEGEVAIPGVYNYNLGPHRGRRGVDNYLHYTILEKFGARTCNVTLAELKPAFKAAHPEISSQDQLTAYFFGSSSLNGTFTVSAGDRIADRHGGFGVVPAADIQAALITNKEITVSLPQTYEAKPGVALGKYLITRILKTDGSQKVKKVKQP